MDPVVSVARLREKLRLLGGKNVMLSVDGIHRLGSECEEAACLAFSEAEGKFGSDRTLPSRLKVGGAEVMLLESPVSGRFAGRSAIVTGAGGGLGLCFAEFLLKDGASVMLADIDSVKLDSSVCSLRTRYGEERVEGSTVDVSSFSSTRAAVVKAVEKFGGVDILISDAGIVRAGGIETMDENTLRKIADVNYVGYFNMVKAVTPVMKAQTEVNENAYADIIQINSKSGIRGSKANFAYSGSKFGGIGLTQSFALELAPFRIKVNSVCPGNWYDGELWSDPEKGLFRQYFEAGKIPGAKSVEDVRAYYVAQAPMRKGCTPEELYRAIVYAIEQTGETGQAIPVTGGQVMLN